MLKGAEPRATSHWPHKMSLLSVWALAAIPFALAQAGLAVAVFVGHASLDIADSSLTLTLCSLDKVRAWHGNAVLT